MRRTWWVLGAAAIAGVVDISYAAVFWWFKAGVAPSRILKSVAAGLLGRDAFTGGPAIAALGLGLHFLNATIMAVAWYAIARRWQLLVDRAVVMGAGYGLLLYGIMNYVVIPLSAASAGSRDPLWVGLTIAIHVFGVGIPIAACTRRALQPPQPSSAVGP